MTEEEPSQGERAELSPLEMFVVKVGIVTVAIIVILYAGLYFLQSFADQKIQQFAFLKGGTAFWSAVEQKLTTMADEPDLPAERKQKIIDALHRLSVKYQPYLQALNSDEPHNPK
jgi:Tfp pilus assembly protein PilN